MRKQARPDIRFLQQEGPERRRVLLLIPRTQAMHSNLFRPTQWAQESTQVLDQQFGDFKGSEMPTMRHLSPARNPQEALTQFARRIRQIFGKRSTPAGTSMYWPAESCGA